MVAEWKRSKFGSFVKRFLKLSEKIGVKYADKVITDNKVIFNDLLDNYQVQSSVIEYGGDHSCATTLSKKTASKYSIYQNNYAFKVCRIVPEK